MMPRPAIYLSDFSARTARAEDKEYALPDNRLAGFALRVQPTGTKSWMLRVRFKGVSKRVTLGNTASMSAEEARARAHQMLAAHTPSDLAVTISSKPAITLAQLAERFLQEKQAGWAPGTLKAVKTYLSTQLLPAFGHRQINQLITAEIADWFHTYSAVRPGGANQALTHLRTMLKFARQNGFLSPDLPDPSNPIRRNTRRARGRLLTTAQLQRLGVWLSAPPMRWQDVADAIHLILLTGCRSGEIARLTWSEVGAERLALASTKTGQRDVFLSEPARAILERRRSAPESRYVFARRTDPDRPIAALDTAWRTLRVQIGLPEDIRLHDLRHTYASHAIMSGETLSMAGHLLGHRKPEATEIYAHLDGTFLAQAADRVAGLIEGWLTDR